MSNGAGGSIGEPLTSRDALNYYFESARTPGSIVHGYVLGERPHRGHEVSIGEAVSFAESVTSFHPLFTRRLVPTPLDLTMPHWVSCDVDIERHVFLHRAPTDSGGSYLAECVARVSSQPFDYSRPTWEIHFVTGLNGAEGVPDNGTVMLFKVHHCAIDGMGTSALAHRMLAPSDADVSRFHDDDFVRRIRPIPTTTAAVARLPRELAVFAKAVVVRHRAQRRAELEGLIPSRSTTTFPATRFNRRVTPDMTFGYFVADVDDLRTVRSAVPGATVNDVLLSVVGLGLSSYLATVDETPDETLGVSFPVNVRSGSGSTTANQLAFAVVSMHTHIPDPLDRVRAVASSTSRAKSEVTTRVGALPPNAASVAPAVFQRIAARLQPSAPPDPVRVSMNTMVSNIPYGAAPMEVCGAPVTGVFAPLPTVDGVNLAHVAVSHGSRMIVTVSSHVQLLPDPERYVECLRAALDTLLDAAQGFRRTPMLPATG
ncbi:wax ester/triacylglycerol synthase domain-containing protein [Rhodococcus sp. NBC_00294]|uniref:wax ester/triacylglycerol synthase domain-containing protein n=1 Tax=Rhodococcus sp. NBC_00294 TaxID=2976004 RepID=UPI002E29FC1E|nr:wax ester/triacylglycerol synthase domain-containing protein [Rhodococcus sp. NBC_00294]